MSAPKITIVTSSFNQGRYLEDCFRSLLDENYPNLELLVFDGGSTDGSVDIIKKYAPHITYWESKPDRGQAHAWNKGLSRATGDILNFINSDDCVYKGALRTIAGEFGDADLLGGSVRYFWNSLDNEVDSRIVATSGLNLKSWFQEDHSYIQPGLWFKTEVLKREGAFNEKYRYIFDTDMVVRILARNPKIVLTPAILAQYRLHATSKTVAESAAFAGEYEAFVRDTAESPSPRLNYYPRLRIRRREWENRLASVDSLGKLFRETLRDPKVRFSRMTLGHIRRKLLR